MKIRINNRVFDMSLRCFEFSPIAKENTKYISNDEFNDIKNVVRLPISEDIKTDEI